MMCNRATGRDSEPQEIQPSLRKDTERRIYSAKSGTGKELGSWAIPALDFLIDAAAGVVLPLMQSNSPQASGQSV